MLHRNRPRCSAAVRPTCT